MAINPDTIPFLQPGQLWPPAGELGEERLRRYAKNKALFRGEHFRVYDDTIKLLRDDVRATLELAIKAQALLKSVEIEEGTVAYLQVYKPGANRIRFMAGEVPDEVWNSGS